MRNCLIFYAKLSHFLRKIVSFFMQNCLIFYAKLSHFLRKHLYILFDTCPLTNRYADVVEYSAKLQLSSTLNEELGIETGHFDVWIKEILQKYMHTSLNIIFEKWRKEVLWVIFDFRKILQVFSAILSFLFY